MPSVLRTALRLSCVLAAATLFGCPSKTETKPGPYVANIGDDAITSEEFKRRIDETTPFLRQRYTNLDRKKEFLENLIKNELLAQEAKRRGLDKSPAVREQVKRAMVQELLKQQLDEKAAGAEIPEAELKAFYDKHLDEYVKPERARVFRILLEAPEKDTKARAAAKKKAAELLAQINEREAKGERTAFQLVAQKESQDKVSAAMSGDLRFLTKDELAKAYSQQLADAAFNLKWPEEKGGPFESPQGIELLKLQVKTVAMDRKFEEAKESIRARLARERRGRDYDEFVKKLREGGNVRIDEAELAKVNPADAPVPGAPGGPPGMPGMPPAMPPGVPLGMPPRPAPVAPPMPGAPPATSAPAAPR
jgi:peptidyl-prolyl cis-trans isomerase C